MVLGVILAPLADENFRRAMIVFEDKSFGFVLSQWVGTGLLIAVLFIFLEGLWRARGAGNWQKSSGAQPEG
jgi:putative tricarboxylic transport membrane protein